MAHLKLTSPPPYLTSRFNFSSSGARRAGQPEAAHMTRKESLHPVKSFLSPAGATAAAEEKKKMGKRRLQLYYQTNHSPTQTGRSLVHRPLAQVASRAPTSWYCLLHLKKTVRPRLRVFTRPFFNTTGSQSTLPPSNQTCLSATDLNLRMGETFGSSMR